MATVDAPPRPDEEVAAPDVDAAGPSDGGDAAHPRRGTPRAGRRIVRRPVEWARRPWPTSRTVRFAVTAVSLIITTVVMMNVVHLNPFNMRSDLIFDNNTPTGGDMGAHVWGPAFLRDNLLPNWQLSGWSMDWYAGFPMYRFYMVVPALAIVALDTILPYGVAFKLVAVAGLVTLPFCCWAFGRLARFRYPLPELFAFAGLCFALDESFSIYGGNLKSTMAGEFSFSIALSLMILGWGLLARAMQTGGKLRNWAAIVLALAVVCHGIVAIYAVVGAAIIVLVHLDSVRRLVLGASIGLFVILLSAWWIGPFVGNHQYMTDMKYGARPDGATDSFWDMFFPLTAPLDILVTTLAVIGLIGCIARRNTRRHRPRRDRPHHRRPRLPDPRQPAGHRAAVEPAPAAADLLRPLPADDGRRRRGRRAGRQPVAQPGAAHGDRLGRRLGDGRRRRPPRAADPRLHVRGAARRRAASSATTPPRRCTRGARSRRRRPPATPRATVGRVTTSPATRAARSTRSTTTSSRRWPRSARPTGAAASSGRTTRTTASTARRWR